MVVRVRLYATLWFLCVARDAGHAGSLEAVQSRANTQINPSLDPKSHSHFFDKDNPHDDRPRVNRWHKRYDFDHPYPIVQEDSKYDADFVKDENDDSGEWKAQMTYDKLRIEIAKAKAKVDEFKAKLQRADDKLKRVKAAERDAEKAAKAIEDAAKKTKQDATDRKEKFDSTSGQSNAERKVQKEMNDLDDCKKQLEKAKKALEDLVQQHKVAEKELDTEQDQEEALEGTAKKSRSVADDLAVKTQKEKEEYLQAKRAYDKQAKIVNNTEIAFEQAASRLRQFRRRVDPDGGVYHVPGRDGKPRQSGCSAMGCSWWLFFCFAAACHFMSQ